MTNEEHLYRPRREEKYIKAKIERVGVNSTAGSKSADEQLQISDEVGVVDRCFMVETFWPPFLLYAL